MPEARTVTKAVRRLQMEALTEVVVSWRRILSCSLRRVNVNFRNEVKARCANISGV